MHEPPTDDARAAAYSAMLPVRDLKHTIAWYKALGFSVGDLFGNPPEWCCLCFDDARLFFKQQPSDSPNTDPSGRAIAASHANCPPPPPGDTSPLAASPLLSVQIDDVPAAHAEFTRRGLAPSDLRMTPAGAAEFELRDPDGYALWFGAESNDVQV